jgi:hypothetical protein
MPGGQATHLLIEKSGHEIVEHLDHGDIEAPLHQGLRQLDSDETCPNQDHMLDAAAAQNVVQTARIPEGVERLHALRIDPRYGRPDRATTRRQDQLVVRECTLRPGSGVPDVDDLLPAIDGNGFFPAKHVEALYLLKEVDVA